jgi:hypothetical protein
MQAEATGGQVGFTWCSVEGDNFSLPERSDVAHGSDGMFT